MTELSTTASTLWATCQGWITGGALAAVGSYSRFNTPPNSRSSTTWGRYHTLSIVYTSAFLVVWITLANTPDLFPWLAKEAGLALETTTLAAPLYAALLLTVLVGVKPFSKADQRIRAFLQDLARIPWEAQRLSAALRARTWLPNALLQDSVRAALKDDELTDQDVSFAGDRTPAALWTKIMALHLHVRGWEQDDSRFAGFYGKHRAEFQRAYGEFETLQDSVRRYFRVMRSLDSVPASPQIEAARAELTRHFTESATRLETMICDLVSRALLSCALTENARSSELEAMGFVVNVEPSRLFDRMLALYLGLAAVFITVITWNGRPKPFLAGAIVATIQIGAVLAALYPKRWTWALPNAGGRSIRAYTLSAMLAGAFSLVASFGLGVLLTLHIKDSLVLLVDRWWPWALNAAAIAFVTAWLADNRDRPRLRWLEAGTQGVLGGVGAGAVWLMLRNLCAGASPDCAPHAISVIVNNAICGAVIGFCVPTWYRLPQTMTIEYRKWKVTVTTSPGDEGRVLTTIELAAPAAAGSTRATLGSESEYSTAEEATAAAIAQARRWIDRAQGAA